MTDSLPRRLRSVVAPVVAPAVLGIALAACTGAPAMPSATATATPVTSPTPLASADPSPTPTLAAATAPPSVETSPTVAPSPSASTRSHAGARLEPDEGVLLGMSIDWGSDSPSAVERRLGRSPAVWVEFVNFPFSAADRANMAAVLDAVAERHAMALLTLQPNAGLGAIDGPAIGDLLAALADARAKGVDVLVRFAHEMNGTWYAWGQQPAAYVAAFRRVASAVHAEAPNAAMLWAPNDGGGYPFAGGRYEAKPGTSDFAILDTNADGRLTMADDPYAPYYPGDDAVDWVGMSLYHWGDRWPWGRNVLPEPAKFAEKLTGTYDGTAGDETDVPDFYAVYAAGHAKPMAIPETAAFYRPSLKAGAAELGLKQAWWREVFSSATLERFPQIRLIDWFEQRKYETEVSDVVDWRLSATPAIASAFLADLPSGFRFAAAAP
jgi:hypothetical protein